jgi:hypothetical protein
MFTAMSEFGEPFVSESIWTEAAFDIMFRKGRSREGYQIYNEDDTAGNKANAIFKHLVKAQMPFSAPQLQRLGRTIEPINVVTKGKYDKYGQTYEFGDEFGGLFGFRAVQVNPGRTMKFKVAEYQKGVRNAGSLFTRETLRGGPIEPREIVDAYINANRALFQTKKDLKLDMDAARLLGIKATDYEKALDRISNLEVNAIDDGYFRPYKISQNIANAFEDNAKGIGATNPLDKAGRAIDKIASRLERVSLDEVFPNIENPLVPMNLGTPLNIPGAATLPNVESELTAEKGIIPVTGQVNQASMFPNFRGQNTPYNQLTTQQKIDILFGRG